MPGEDHDPLCSALRKLLKPKYRCIVLDQGNHENLSDFILCEMTEAGNLKPLRTVPVSEFDLRTPVFKLNGYPIYVLRGNVRAVRARVTEGTIRRDE